jgi:hypothetical protein
MFAVRFQSDPVLPHCKLEREHRKADEYAALEYEVNLKCVHHELEWELFKAEANNCAAQELKGSWSRSVKS